MSERPPCAATSLDIVVTFLVKSTTPAIGEVAEEGVCGVSEGGLLVVALVLELEGVAGKAAVPVGTSIRS